MKMHTSILAILICLGVSASPSIADPEHSMPVYEGSQAFQQMKQLAGKWIGTVDMGKGPETIDASYRVTSAGSVLVETIFEGTPNEMVTIYHDDKKQRLGLTHYCGLNNQPKLTLIKSEENALEFDLAQDAPIDAAYEPHMHALKLTFSGKNEMQQHWTQFAQGEKKKVVTLSFKRAQ
jgi:hypothetical protein